MNPIFAAAADVQAFCRLHQWRFCFIGTLAVQRWGEPRLTQDVGLTVITGFGGEEACVDALLSRFRPRRPDGREFALAYRVLLLYSATSIPIDVALGAMPFEERAAARASDFSINDTITLRTCSAEDLIVFKAFAGRDQDWLDIEGIAVRQRSRLDEAQVWAEISPLLELKGTPEAADRLRAVLARTRGGSAGSRSITRF